MNEEAIKTKAALSRTKKACRICSIIFMVVLVLVCLFLLGLIGLFIFAAVSEGSSPLFQIDGLDFLRATINFLLVIVIIVSAIQMLSSVSKGDTPFTKTQVKRIRRIALMILLYFICEILISPGVLAFFQDGFLTYSYHGTSTADNALIPVNLGALLVSGGFFCLSLVFEYGVLLQEQSDETL